MSSSFPKVPQVGDTVYVIGHGPAKLLESKVRGKKKYKVEYPDGGTVHVTLEQILEFQTTPNYTPPGSPSPPRRSSLVAPMSPRAAPVSSTGPRQLEYLGRAFDDEARRTHSPAAIFGLVATMTGGGVLSLPYALSQCGLVMGISVLLLSGIASYWSFDMLVESARLTGRDTFELVGHAAFGESGRTITMVLVFIICWLASVGYYVILGDLLVPILKQMFPFADVSHSAWRIYALCGATVMLAPMCFKANLNALRYVCFASASSVMVVAFVIALRAWPTVGEDHTAYIQHHGESGFPVTIPGDIDIWPKDWWMAMYSVPTFAVSFMCQFNALPTHMELIRPTSWRIRRVSAASMALTTAIYLFVAVSGYVYGGACTCGNILLNFQNQDVAAIIARTCLSCVVMLNMPLLVQPARNSLFRLIAGTTCCGASVADSPPTANATEPQPPPNSNGDISLIQGGSHPPSSIRETGSSQPNGAELSESPSNGMGVAGTMHMVASNGSLSSFMSEGGPCGQSQQTASTIDPATIAAPAAAPVTAPEAASYSSNSSCAAPAGARTQSPNSSPDMALVHVYRRQDTHGPRDHREGLEALDTFLPKDDTVLASAVQPTQLQRCILTTGLILTSLTLALCLQSVMVVWSILGSTVCFLVGFILPSSFWCKIVGPHVQSIRYSAALGLICMTVFLSLFCTGLTMQRLDLPPCPLPQSYHLTA